LEAIELPIGLVPSLFCLGSFEPDFDTRFGSQRNSNWGYAFDLCFTVGLRQDVDERDLLARAGSKGGQYRVLVE
jgi:hypothetical protein